MTSYVLGIIATLLWIGAPHEKSDAASTTDVALAIGCAIAAIILAIV